MKLVFNKKEMCLIAKKEDLSAFFKEMRLKLEKGDPETLKRYWCNNQGICSIIYEHLLCKTNSWKMEHSQEIVASIWDAVMLTLEEAFKTWPEYSGHPKWPINVKSSKKSPINQFKQLRHWKGKQLQARLNLLRHLEKHIEDTHIQVMRKMTDYTIDEFCDKHGACSEGHEWAMKYYTSMNDVWKTIQPDWLVWTATRPGVLTDKELRLFAVFCARQVQHMMTDPRSIDAIDVAERFAHGEASAEELAAASVAVRDALSVAASAAANDVARAALRDALSVAASAAARAALKDTVRDAVKDAAWAAASDALRGAAVSVALRDAVSVAAWAAANDASDAAIYAAGVAARDAQSAWLRANTKPNFSKPEVKNDLP